MFSLKDIVFHGSCFTWRGKRGGEEIRIRLDQFLASKSWSDLFPVSRVVHQFPNKSNHLPIVLEVHVCRPKMKMKKKKKFFHFGDRGGDRLMDLIHSQLFVTKSNKPGVYSWNGVKPNLGPCARTLPLLERNCHFSIIPDLSLLPLMRFEWS